MTAIGAGDLVPKSSPQPKEPREGRPLARQRVTAIGDSVLLSARAALTQSLPKLTIDAAIARQPYETIDRVTERLRAGALAGVVVIETGTNGIPDASDLHRVLSRLDAADVSFW